MTKPVLLRAVPAKLKATETLGCSPAPTAVPAVTTATDPPGPTTIDVRPCYPDSSSGTVAPPTELSVSAIDEQHAPLNTYFPVQTESKVQVEVQ